MPLDISTLKLAANTIRTLSAEGVEKANSGHPGMPMGMADIAAVLWLKYLKISPNHPEWVNRDRFVLSNGHGSMLLYSLLHLAGFDLTIDDLKSFRQFGSKTPGHPEFHVTPGVEATTGPLGQGLSNAVGMSIASKLLGARFNTAEQPIVDHRVFVFAGDGCLMEGVTSESSSLAGHLGLDNLVVLYDDNHISIAGHTELAFTESVTKRYAAYGWRTIEADGHDFDAIDRALAEATRSDGRPTIVAFRTHIGKGSPNKIDTNDVHGSPLGKEELALVKRELDWPLDKEFYIPAEVAHAFDDRREEMESAYVEWCARYADWGTVHPPAKELFELMQARAVPADLRERLLAAVPRDGKSVATRKLSSDILQVLSASVPSLVGGSADLDPSTLTYIKGSEDIQRGAFQGKNLRFGVREHGMGAIMNGMSYYGAFLPYGSTFLCFSDYMRPTVRIAALSELPGLFIYTHDSVFLGEDGPTHQPVEHLNSLRMIPNNWVFRPADGVEVAVCYALGATRRDGPATYAFSRQNLEPIERGESFSADEIEKGAYTVFESGPTPELVIVATGSEVSLAISAAKLLALKRSVRVVSIPCRELFARQGDAYRLRLIPRSAKKVTIEAGVTIGWTEFVGGSSDDTLCIGIDHYGASAPAKVIAEKFGFTPQAVVSAIESRFAL